MIIFFSKSFNSGYSYVKNGKIVRVSAYSDRRVKKVKPSSLGARIRSRDDKTTDMFGTHDGPVVMDRQKLIDEHEHLVDVLESPSHADDKKEAVKQAKELEGYKEPSDQDLIAKYGLPEFNVRFTTKRGKWIASYDQQGVEPVNWGSWVSGVVESKDEAARRLKEKLDEVEIQPKQEAEKRKKFNGAMDRLLGLNQDDEPVTVQPDRLQPLGRENRAVEDVANAEAEKPVNGKSKVSSSKPKVASSGSRLSPEAFYGDASSEEMKLPKKDIANLIRADIKKGIQAGRIPVGTKISVKTSDHNEINVRVKGLPDGFRVNNPDFLVEYGNHPDYHYGMSTLTSQYTPEARKLLDDLEWIHAKYNWDKSDSQTDYFNKNYYGDAKFGSGIVRLLPKSHEARSGESKTIEGITYELSGEPKKWRMVSGGGDAAKAKESTPVSKPATVEAIKPEAEAVKPKTSTVKPSKSKLPTSKKVFTGYPSTRLTRMSPDEFYGVLKDNEKDGWPPEIAKKMREDIKRGIEAGRIPVGTKISVTSKKHSISIYVTGVPEGFRVNNPDYLMAAGDNGNRFDLIPKDIPRWSPEMTRLMGDLKHIEKKYNWDKSDYYSDYHNTNYYSDLGVDLDQVQQLPNATTTAIGTTKTIEGITYTLDGDPPRWHKTSGDVKSATVKNTSKEEPETKRLARASRLLERGESALESAKESMGRDRLANTARRARMAAGSEKAAAIAANEAQTAINIANALKDGSTSLKVRSMSDVRLLEKYYVQAAGSYLDRNESGYRADTYDRARAGIGVDDGMLNFLKYPENMPDDHDWVKKSKQEERDHLDRLGINNQKQLADAIKEFMDLRAGMPKKDPLKEAERALIGQKVGVDFFPTPKPLAEKMAKIAGIKPGMKVLEPSAGNGHLADAARDAGASVDAVELSPTLQNILKLKNHNLIGTDFMDIQPAEQYDAVLMNPPFSSRKDAEHIQRAYDMLKPGGTLVAISGEGVHFGDDRKAVNFRDWLDSHNADVEKLPANSFMGPEQLAQTGVNARLIVMKKPVETVRQKPVVEDAPRVVVVRPVSAEKPNTDDFSSARDYLNALTEWRKNTGNTNAYEERKENRVDRLNQAADRAASRSESAFRASDRAVSGIPMGQPILVGHHSEKTHRAALSRADSAMRRSLDESKKASDLVYRADAAASNKAISSDDEDAVFKLKAKIETLEQDQERFKLINKAVKSKKLTDDQKIAEMVQAGVTEREARAYLKPDIQGYIGVPPWQLTNNNANIRRIKERVQLLERQAKEMESMMEANNGAPIIHQFDGGRVKIDFDENRVKIIYNGKPSEEVRANLKSRGFRWSPSNGAWQRQLNDNAKYYAEYLTGLPSGTLSKSPMAKSFPRLVAAWR